MRHLKLFQRFLNENNSTSIIDEIIQLDDELENNPVYKQYEREFVMEMFEPHIDEQTFREKRGNIMPMVDRIIKLAEKDQEFRLCAKLKRYNDLLAQI